MKIFVGRSTSIENIIYFDYYYYVVMVFSIIQFQFNDAESRWNDGEVIVDAVEGSCSHDAWIYLTCRIFDY